MIESKIFFFFLVLNYFDLKGCGSSEVNHFSLSVNNQLNRSITIQSYNGKFSRDILGSLTQVIVNFKDGRIKVIKLTALDTLTKVPLDINGQSSLTIRTSNRIHVLDVSPRAFTRIPAFFYKYQGNSFHGYPRLTEQFPSLTSIKTAVMSTTRHRFEAATGSCFLNPDICKSGSSVGMKLKLDSKKNENKQIVFILKSEGIEVFEDEYERLCGLLRTRRPSREWKVCVRNIQRNHWTHFALTWHPRRGLRLYIDSQLKKTNRYGRTINQRAGTNLNKLLIGNTDSASQMSSFVLEEKQWDKTDVGQTMICFWNSNTGLYWSEYEIFNYALVDVSVIMNNKRKVTLKPNTFFTLASKDFTEETSFTFVINVSAVGINRPLYINNEPTNKVIATLEEPSLLNEGIIIITEKLYS